MDWPFGNDLSQFWCSERQRWSSSLIFASYSAWVLANTWIVVVPGGAGVLSLGPKGFFVVKIQLPTGEAVSAPAPSGTKASAKARVVRSSGRRRGRIAR